MHRSSVKVISQPDPQFGQGSDNPLSVLGQALFPAGNSNAPMEQLQQFYRLGVQAMSKAQSAGGETRSNSAPVNGGCHGDDDDDRNCVIPHSMLQGGVGWLSGRTSVSDRRTFTGLHRTCS